jgi:multiple sugar transport system permease protein
MGYASALAWILLVIVAVITALNFAASRYWVFYESDGRGGK